MTIRYGIIGCGMMAIEHIENIELLEGAEVVAVVDPEPDMLAKGLFHAGKRAAAYASAAEVAQSGNCDAFIIATPNDTHLDVLSQIATCGRPVLMEKPLCARLDDCREAARIAEIHEFPLWVAMEYRFMPPLAELIRLADAGEAGPPIMMSIREHRFPFLPKVGFWNRFNRRTGGTLVEKCCHFWDLMRVVLKSDPVRVFASGAINVNHLDEKYDGETPDIIDNAFAVIDFKNGSRGMLDLCMFAEGSYWQETVSVTGPKARIDAMVPPPARLLPEGCDRQPIVEVNPRDGSKTLRRHVPVDPQVMRAGDHCGATYFQHEQFLALANGKITKPMVTAADGSWAVAVGEAAEQSAQTGKAVDIIPP